MAGSSLVLFMLLTMHWGAFVATTITRTRIILTNTAMNSEKRQCGTHFEYGKRNMVMSDFMWPRF